MDDDPAAIPARVLSDFGARENLAHCVLRRRRVLREERWRGRGTAGSCLTNPLLLAHSFQRARGGTGHSARIRCH